MFRTQVHTACTGSSIFHAFVVAYAQLESAGCGDRQSVARACTEALADTARFLVVASVYHRVPGRLTARRAFPRAGMPASFDEMCARAKALVRCLGAKKKLSRRDARRARRRIGTPSEKIRLGYLRQWCEKESLDSAVRFLERSARMPADDIGETLARVFRCRLRVFPRADSPAPRRVFFSSSVEVEAEVDITESPHGYCTAILSSSR